MWTKLYWANGPWPGRLALSARPRGGDWLADEMDQWRRAGVDIVLSLLTKPEERDLNLEGEEREANRHGIDFWSFPIPDREVPARESEWAALLENIDRALASGKNVVLHCRQGIGRTGLVAACLLLSKGASVDAVVKELSSLRGVEIPETVGQRAWIDHFAASLAASR